MSGNTGVNNQSKINFGTNLTVDKGVVDRLNKHPEEIKQIQNFKEYLAKDGKDWNAELSYDTFTPTKKNTSEQAEETIKKAVVDYDWRAREIFSDAISSMQPEEAVALIKKLSNDPNLEIQKAAVEATGKINDSKVAVNLITEFVQGTNQNIKESAIYSIGTIENSAIKNQILQTFVDSKDPIVRKESIVSALRRPDVVFLNDSLEKYSKDSEPEIRRAVLYKIQDLEDKEYNKKVQLYDSIIENSLKDPNSRVRETAGELIGKLSNPQKAASLLNETIENQENRWERRYLAETAKNIKDTKIEKETIEKLLEHPDNNVREGATIAALSIKDEKIKNDFMEKLINSNDVGIKKGLASSLSEIKDSKKVSEMADKFLNDSDSEVRREVFWGLTNLSDEKTKYKIIQKYISSPNLDIKEGILECVGRGHFNDFEKSKEIVQILTQDKDKGIQKQAKEVLEDFKKIEEQNHYNLKITDGNKVLGQKPVIENKYQPKSMFDGFFDAYKSVFEKTVNGN